MAGKPKYERKNSKKSQQEKEKITFDSVEKKFKKENMSVAEFAMLLCKVKGLPPNAITEKTVKNYLKTICEESEERISLNDFKHDPDKSGSKYEFKPEIHSLLLTLMSTDYFDGRRNDRKLKTRKELYRQMITNINQYLSEEDKKIIKQNPVYSNALLEIHLTEHINQQLTNLLRTMYHSDPVLRYQFMIEFLSSLTQLGEWMDKEDCKAMSTRMVYAHELDEMKDALYQKGLFKSITLDEFIINLLALRMQKKEYEYISEDEELQPAAVYLATKLYDITIKDGTDLKQLLDKIDSAIANEKRYKEIMNKAESILDLQEPLENNLYQCLKKLVGIQYLRPEVSPEDYERTVRFTESCIAKDKWDILSEFAKMGRGLMSPEQIKKIMDIKDHSEYSEISEK